MNKTELHFLFGYHCKSHLLRKMAFFILLSCAIIHDAFIDFPKIVFKRIEGKVVVHSLTFSFNLSLIKSRTRLSKFNTCVSFLNETNGFVQ